MSDKKKSAVKVKKQENDDSVVLKVTGGAVDVKIEVAKNKVGSTNRRPIGVMIK